MKYFLHKKGGVYVLLHRAQLEANEQAVCVYQGLSVPAWSPREAKPEGTVWVRPAAEFDDVTRFVEISPFDAQQIAKGETTEPMEYAPVKADLRCPSCWTTDKVDLGDVFLSGMEASCSRCGANWLYHNFSDADF